MAARLDGPSSGPRDRQFSPRDAVDVLAKLARRRRFVQFMKFVLPALAVATMAVVVGWPRLTNREAMLPLSFSALESENAALVMSNPRYRGTDSNNQPYRVTADRAVQDPDDDQLVTLDKVNADISVNDGTWWSLTADTGFYDGNTSLLNLFGNVEIFGDAGYEMHTNSAEIDLKKNTVSSDEKVWGHSAMGEIRANGLRVYNGGRDIHFVNGVNTTIFPREQRS